MQKIIFGVLVSAFLALSPSVSAQSISWAAPKYTGATACKHATELKYVDLRDNSKEKTAVDQGRCVPITVLKAADATRQVCATDFNITYVDKTIFPNFEEVDAGKITDPENYAYPVAMCDTGKLCVVCTQGTVTASQGSGTTTATPSASSRPVAATSSGTTSTSSAQTPVSGVLENTLLLLLLGGLVIGLGSYHLVRHKA